MTVNVELFNSLDAVERDAEGALDRDRQRCPYSRLYWYRLTERFAPPEGELLVARAAEGPRRAWLFLARQGRAASGYGSWYSLRMGPAGDPKLLPDLARGLKTRLSRVRLTRLGDPEPVAEAFREAGWLVFTREDTANWQVDTIGEDFATYWSKRPGKLRNTAKRKAKAARLEIEINRGFDEAGWAAYEQIYAQSWKPEEGSPAFLRALAEEEGAAGTLRLGIARKNGRPVAAQLWTVEDGTATIHKLAYVEDAKELSPGTILGVEMFRHALDVDRAARIDYGTGDDPYKREWMDERHMLWAISAYHPRSLSGLLGALRELVGRLRRR